MTVSVRLSPEQVSRLDELAGATYRRRSDLIRLAVDSLITAEANGTILTPDPDADLRHRNPVLVPDVAAKGKDAA